MTGHLAATLSGRDHPATTSRKTRFPARSCDFEFRRQVPWGPFILDFFAPVAGLVVEVDGKSHLSRAAADARRDRKLERAGLRVLRVSAELVLGDLESAVERVRAALKASTR